MQRSADERLIFAIVKIRCSVRQRDAAGSLVLYLQTAIMKPDRVCRFLAVLPVHLKGEVGVALRCRNVFVDRTAWPDSKHDGLVVFLLMLAGKHERSRFAIADRPQ